jgi:AcrR family transcriptional regulator
MNWFIFSWSDSAHGRSRTGEARIVEAAAALFQERGFEETTMQEVAGRAGLAVGTLYNYFRSKSGLGLALVRRDADEGVAAGEQIVKEPPDDPGRALTALLERAMVPSPVTSADCGASW